MKTVLVVFGGMSSEHDVSVRSAYCVSNQLISNGYPVQYMYQTRKGVWLHSSGRHTHFISENEMLKSLSPVRDVLSSLRQADVVFPLIHGFQGEDGTIQGFLTFMGIPYVGCGVKASSLCFDKSLAKRMLKIDGIPQSRYIHFTIEDYETNYRSKLKEILHFFSFPLYVKPACSGSSIGITRVTHAYDLERAIRQAFKHGEVCLIEEEIVGREIEVGVLYQDGKWLISPPGEIITDSEFYDYESKYHKPSTLTRVPADLSQHTLGEIHTITRQVIDTLGITSYARLDLFVKKETERVYANEVNTVPGFTSRSMYPLLMEAAGIPYEKLLDTLIMNAFHHNKGAVI
ncbi:D-alanine--D-alanine ligase (plasmid) [Pontibacillus sp. ALD_SL1]|uniref:D-alanine--D-alanine ligase family protein n=1 Tax=Pontibacillus sp. ALD_SL1 TaxID=2777185 RepID=UPI001A96BA09|nr:D-alanine--D-alanine ligase family protein [Pontibacillus sp. ALD_SL1]QST02320.1 D-alanine--D-alanine ligase [Pontibacillus sp. ALD_SL1]